jgi:CHAT domain-containing protein
MSVESSLTSTGQDLISNLGTLNGADELNAFLERHPHLVSPATVEQLGDLVRQKVRVNVDESLRLAEAALAIAGRLSDTVSLARSLRAKANALWFQGDCRTAVELFEKAATEFEAADMSEELGRTLSSSIQALALLGEYDKAFAVASRARQIFTSLGDEWRKARLELNVANIHHRQDRFAEALSAYERAYDELLPYKDSEGLGVAQHNMAVCLIMLNDFDRALACYTRVRELCATNHMPLLGLQAEYNIAYLYFLRGDFDAAIEALSRTRVRSRENGDAYHSALCDLDQAEIYLELNLTEEAARMADEARLQFEALSMAFETGRSVADLAIASHRRRETARALDLFAQARSVFERENNQAWQALIDLYEAMVSFEIGKCNDARSLCSNARKYFASAGLDRREILCDLLLVRVSLRKGEAAEARESCRLVLQRLDDMEAPLLAFQAHLLLGNAERILGDWRTAYEAYNNARAQLETLRSSIQGEELKVSFLKDKVDVYQRLVELCLDERSGATADTMLEYFEQAKSRSLVEILFGRSRPFAWSEATGHVAEEIRSAKRELNWLYRRLELEQGSREGMSVECINALRRQARSKEDEFLRMLREFERTNSRSDVFGTAAPATPSEIRSAVGGKALMIEYFQTEREFVAAVISDTSTNIVRLAPIEQVTSRIRMLDFQLSKFRLQDSYAAEFAGELLAATQNRLRELHADLIAPLSGLLNRPHLVIVPHGILHYVPFHALFDGRQYLIDRFTISSAPSASIYTLCDRKPANSRGPSLLMGVQDENARFIEAEVQSVGAVVPDPKVFLGESATTHVLRSIGPQCRLIHIATHGVFRRDNPMFSSVRLGDSYMSLYDLYELKLPVELLTLSGCGTGLNVVAAGDELLGLTRGLLCAGAQTVLLSLWDVHDQTTAEFMSSFYSHVAKGCEKPVALRAAMIETRCRRPHPYYWAPFVIVGKAFSHTNR